VPPDFLERVLQVSQRMAAMRSLAPLLVCVVEEAIQLTGAQRGYVVLRRSNGSLDFRITRDQEGHEVENAQDQISTSVLNQVIQMGQPVILRDAMSDPNFAHARSVMALKLRSIMSVPLVSHGETIGALYVENRTVQGRFQEEDLAPLILFANQAAVAIENASINDDLEARVAARTRELEQALAQIEKSWAEAVETNRVRTVLLGNIAHDLRASVGIAVTAWELLKDGSLGPMNADQAGWIAKSQAAVTHSQHLLDDVFDLSRLEVGELTLYCESVALGDFLQRVYGIGQGLRWPQAVTFQLDLSPDLPAVYIDPVRIEQVLLNFLTNAVKFTERGSVTLHAHYMPEPREVVIGVADTGEGIPLDQMGQVFQRFQQVDQMQARRRKGAGLGLAICRELVEMHGGRIWVESTLGIGSNFMFSLPVNPPTNAQRPTDHARRATSPRSELGQAD
jgi:signal transduction histidine kinase